MAIVVPTFNESLNISELASRLTRLLDGESYEIIFVDDHSPDGTAGNVRALSAKDGRIRCIERVGRRGLSTAVIEGLLATSAEYAVVMDADLQHDESLVPQMISALREGYDLAVGSRYVEGGGTGDWSNAREKGSRYATRLAQMLNAGDLSDPMSGFFAIRTQAVRERAEDLTGTGYKILLDIVATKGPELKIKELPYEFRARQLGESKLDTRVLLEFLELLLAKTVGKYIPTKFVMFSIVGGLGVVVHFAVLSLTYGPLTFVVAQGIATMVAMTANFFVNNVFTYFDRRLRGWQLVPGWISFCAASSVGALANVGVAAYLFTSLNAIWYLSALAGIIVGAAWNFAVTALYTWKA